MLAPRGNGPHLAPGILAERLWESRPQRVKAPYAKGGEGERYPEYHGTRETLWEVGGTTPQG